MRSNPKSVNHHVSAISDFFAERFLRRTWKRRNFPLISLVDWPPTKNILIANGSSILLSSSILWNNSLISTKTPLIYLKFKKKTFFCRLKIFFYTYFRICWTPFFIELFIHTININRYDLMNIMNDWYDLSSETTIDN